MKIESPKFNKVKMKLKIIDTQYTFYGKDGKEEKITVLRGFGDNEKIIRNILSNDYNLSMDSIDGIVVYLSTVYRMNLENLGF